MNLLLEGLNGLFLLPNSLAASKIGNFFGNSGNSLLEGLNGSLKSLLLFLYGLDLLFNDGLLTVDLGVLKLCLIGLDVLFNNLKLVLGSRKLNLSLFLNMSLLANLSINVGFILSNFFDLGVKLLLFLESFNLSLDDGDFIFLLGDIFFLGFDDNLRDSDLLLDMLFVGLNLLKLLGGVGQLSSSSCLLSDGLFSGGSKSLNFLSVIDNGSGDLVNILLDLGLLSNGNNLDLVSEVLLLLNKRGSGRGDGIDLALDLGDGLGSRFDGRLKIGSLGSEGLHLGGNLSLLLLKGLFLLLNESSKFLLGLSGNGVGFLISLERLFLLM